MAETSAGIGHESLPVVRAAVVGCGAIAHEHLAALATLDDVEVIAVADPSPAAAELVQERFRVPLAFASSGELFGALAGTAAPDVVHVLTPPDTHVAVVEQALRAGCHVVCEKPMTPSAGETIELIADARGRELRLMETRNLLYNDVVVEIDRMVADGRLGDIREVEVSLCLDLTAGPFGDLNLTGPGVALPGGAVHDLLPHLAYLGLHFVGDDSGSVDDVIGRLENVSGNRRVGFDALDALVVVGGRRARLHIASDVRPDAFRLRVFGNEATVEADLYNPFLRFEGERNTGKRAPLGQLASALRLATDGCRNARDKVLQHGPMHGLGRQLSAFYESFRSDGPWPVPDQAMIATAVLVDRIVALGDRA